jgi:hypothetical protein
MKDEFLKEFKALLEKYDVSISFSVGAGSDTHGLYDEKMVIDHRIDKNSFKEETWLELNGWCISSYELKDIS